MCSTIRSLWVLLRRKMESMTLPENLPSGPLDYPLPWKVIDGDVYRGLVYGPWNGLFLLVSLLVYVCFTNY